MAPDKALLSFGGKLGFKLIFALNWKGFKMHVFFRCSLTTKFCEVSLMDSGFTLKVRSGLVNKSWAEKRVVIDHYGSYLFDSLFSV